MWRQSPCDQHAPQPGSTLPISLRRPPAARPRKPRLAPSSSPCTTQPTSISPASPPTSKRRSTSYAANGTSSPLLGPGRGGWKSSVAMPPRACGRARGAAAPRRRTVAARGVQSPPLIASPPKRAGQGQSLRRTIIRGRESRVRDRTDRPQKLRGRLQKPEGWSSTS
jgi:hypothetical protein